MWLKLVAANKSQSTPRRIAKTPIFYITYFDIKYNIIIRNGIHIFSNLAVDEFT
jgi:hypothetical protein